jgi:membrane-associated phospholipid phosphatase
VTSLNHPVAGPLVLVIALGLLFLLRQRGARLAAWLEARLPAGVPLRAVAIAALALGAAGVFAKIADEIASRETSDFDRAVGLAIRRLDTQPVDLAMRIASALGSWPVLTVAVVVVVAWCARRGDWFAASTLSGVAICAALLNAALKQTFERLRPDFVHGLAAPQNYAFPSGHAMAAMAIYGMIAFIAARERPGSRWVPFAAAGALVLLIGTSRVFLGVHWTTDVLGGFAGGTFVLLVGEAVLELTSTGAAKDAKR